MKKTTLILIAGMLVAAVAYANDNYMKAMQKGMEELSEASSPEAMLNVSNTFARIANVEKEEWLPAYYAAYTVTMSTAMSGDMSAWDKNLDKADGFLQQASQVSEDNVEILALKGFIQMLRISVDPQTRGQEYSTASGMTLGKARQLDPNNPRVLYFLAQLSYGTAQFFGSDVSESCKLNQIALQQFDTYKDNSEDPFYPSWGKNMALSFQENCN